jgi:Nif-specific regulatory protein
MTVDLWSGWGKITDTQLNLYLPITINTSKRHMVNPSENLSVLYRVSEIVANSSDIEEAIARVMEEMADKIGILQAFLTVLNRNSSKIYIEVAHGLTREQQERGEYRIGEGIIGEVVKNGKPVVIPHISDEPRYLNKTKSTSKSDDDDSFVCVPIKAKSQVIGTLSVKLRYDAGRSLKNELELFTVTASMFARLVRSRQDKIEELDKLHYRKLREQGLYSFNDRITSLVGESGKMQEVYDLISRVASTNATILIRGESGVGKELVAKAIHEQSPRNKLQMISINCSAIPEMLIESELFGYEKGAFTGAEKLHKGRFELAEKSTIFLDEIGDLPPNLQVKLLRILQEKEYQRLGGTETLQADVRIITATNRDLEDLMLKNQFREDLYYRLNVFPLFIPPLRERRADIPLLVNHFIEKYNRIHGLLIKRISSTAIDLLMTYHWPGNIRELENCIERAAILSTDKVIRSHNLPPTLQSAASTHSRVDGSLEAILENVEKQMLIDALNMSKGNISKAAEQLKLTERMMGLRIKKYQIDPVIFKKQNRKARV